MRNQRDGIDNFAVDLRMERRVAVKVGFELDPKSPGSGDSNSGTLDDKAGGGFE